MFESLLIRISAQDSIFFALQFRYIVEFSAYQRKVQLGTQFFKFVTHKSRNAGPKIDLCGAQNLECKSFEQRESMCIK